MKHDDPRNPRPPAPAPSTAEPEKSDSDPHSYDPRHEREKRAGDEWRGIDKEFDRPSGVSPKSP